jgi:hypothetical protein
MRATEGALIAEAPPSPEHDVVGTPEWAAARLGRRLPPTRHAGLYTEYFDFKYAYACCLCADERSAYCCAPDSPTHMYVMRGRRWDGVGPQTLSGSYSR